MPEDEIPELALTPYGPFATSDSAPQEVGDIPVWDGSGYDFLRYVYDVRSYGAVGDGVTDDTEAFQAAVDAAVASPHLGANVYIPAAPTNWKLTSTITIEAPSSGSQTALNIIAEDTKFANIVWAGGNNTSIFKSWGWKMGRVQDVKITLPNNATGVVVWDVDHDSTRSSTGWLRFDGCYVRSNGGASSPDGCVAWRVGHTAGSEFSFIDWRSCTVEFNGVGGVDSIGGVNCVGWVGSHNNGLVLNWVNCGAVGCETAWQSVGMSGSGGSGASSSWALYNCGGSYNECDFDLQGVSYLISGGSVGGGARFPQGGGVADDAASHNGGFG